MRSVIEAITDELRRRKAAGEKTVEVSDEGLDALRRVVEARQPAAAAPASAEAPESRPAAGAATHAAPAPRHRAGAAPAPALRPPEFTLPEGDKAARWQALREIVLGNAVCKAHVRPGKKVVFGVGNLDARIMFVGEAPGADEEVQGEPFVGPAGQLLNRMIKATGLERGDVYIGNVMNWRPELPPRADGAQVGNREPNADEMAFCLPFLIGQIEIVSPAVVVALGATAARGLLGAHTFRSLGEVRGRWHDFNGRPLRVTYHPSYLLRKEQDGPVQSNRAKRAAWEDFLAVMERAGMPISDKQRNYFLR